MRRIKDESGFATNCILALFALAIVGIAGHAIVYSGKHNALLVPTAYASAAR